MKVKTLHTCIVCKQHIEYGIDLEVYLEYNHKKTMTNTPYDQLCQLLTEKMMDNIDTVLMTQVECDKLIPR